MVSTFLAVANNAASTLAKGATAGATTVELIAGGHSAFPAAVPFDVSIDNEILHVTEVAGDVFTVERGAQGTTAHEHSTGAQVQLNVTAKSVSDLNTAVIALQEEAAGFVTLGAPEQTITGPKVFSGAVTFEGAVAMAGSYRYKTTSQVKIEANQNNYNLGATSQSLYQLEPTKEVNITGLSVTGGNSAGRYLQLLNIGTFTINLMNESAESTGVNTFVFSTGANIPLLAKHAIGLIYSSAKSRWTDQWKN